MSRMKRMGGHATGSGRGKAVVVVVALAVVFSAWATPVVPALAAQHGPAARAASSNEGICDWRAEIVLVGFDYPPPGTIVAHGQLLEITHHPALFSLLGTRFGGNGLHHFGVPNLQGRAPDGLHYYFCTTGTYPSPSDQAGNCSWLGQIILTAAPNSFTGTVAADGQLLNTSSNEALSTIYGYSFGGSEASGKFGVPDLRGKAPIPGLSYRVCTSGAYPQTGGGSARCNWLGQIALFGYSALPYTTIPAHGQLLNLATHTPLFALYGFTFGGNGASTWRSEPNRQGPTRAPLRGLHPRSVPFEAVGALRGGRTPAPRSGRRLLLELGVDPVHLRAQLLAHHLDLVL